jgi:DNA polymerase III delta prime subunit
MPEVARQVAVLRHLADRFAEATSQAFVFYGLDSVSWAAPLTKECGERLLCPQGGCGQCSACGLIARGRHPDLLVYGAPYRALRADEAREVIKEAHISAYLGPSRLVVVLGAHLLEEAGVMLLKTAEEPPVQTRMVFVAEYLAPHLATLWSRCVRVPVQTADAAAAAPDWEHVAELAERLRLVLGGARVEASELAETLERSVATERQRLEDALSAYGESAQVNHGREVAEEALRLVLLRGLRQARSMALHGLGSKGAASAEGTRLVRTYLSVAAAIEDLMRELPRNPNARWQLGALAWRISSINVEP